MSVAIVAFGAISALGEGEDAASAGITGEKARIAIAPDAEMIHASLAKPFVARAAIGEPTEDRATVLLTRALEACVRDLDAALPGWRARARRVGLAIGTSSGGMRNAEALFAAVARGEALAAEQVARALYSGPLQDAAPRTGLAFAPATQVLTACASSTVAIGVGARWLAQGECDLVLAGGFDAVSVFVAAGFEVLHATSATVPPRPFRAGRDGMSLGEGAAVLALVRAEDAPRARAYVAGFGAAADGVHLTAPDRAGGGLARAAIAALDEARVARIDLVSAHGTATPFNDPAETRAIERALGDRARDVVVHPFKAQIGHTLGAAGALESLACVDAMTRGVLPAAAGEGPLDPSSSVRLLDVAIAAAPEAALKLSSAFGGANAALVLTRARPDARPSRRGEAYVSRAHRVTALPALVDLAAAVGYPADRLARADALVLHALAAVAALGAEVGPLGGAGIVTGSVFATLETNARFDARIRERGARMAEPRRFPYTSPNAVAGECGVIFGLTGPSVAVGAGVNAGIEALAVATALVRAGDAVRIVVVAVEEIGPVARPCADAIGLGSLASGAVALLVTAERAASSVARVGAIALPLVTGRIDGAPAGFTALAPLTHPDPPTALRGAGGAFVDLDPVENEPKSRGI